MRGLCQTPLKSGLPLAVRGVGPVGAFVDRGVSWPKAGDNKARAAKAVKIVLDKIFMLISGLNIIRKCRVERLFRDGSGVNPNSGIKKSL